MLSRITELLHELPRLTPIAVIDIFLVAFLIYQFISMLQGRRAAHILNGVAILVLVYAVSLWAGMELLPSILAALAPYTVFALIVMFQSEIRRLLARLGRKRWVSMGGKLQRRETTYELLLALEQLAEQKTGALIIMERDIGLRTFIESGVALDAALSRDLLLSIFQPGGALHDGAAIVQGDRVAAAACFLPLTTNPQVMRKLGTRHRAAIGVTEETDCMALVVSEETGRMSIAAGGEIELNANLERIEERLAQHYGRRRKAARPSAVSATVPVHAEEAPYEGPKQP
jgi:diadenylate cyclase